MFRELRAEEIECRVAMCKITGCSLLLYKDARADMIILDETVGAMNWKRSHARDNANCIVEIWDDKKSQWISKEDTGAESNTEKEKGLASDSFKRACFNWGIGRELYTAPFIWIKEVTLKEEEFQGRKKYSTYDKFKVTLIEYKDKKIISLEIANANTGKVVYRLGVNPETKPQQQEKPEATEQMASDGQIADVKKGFKDLSLDGDKLLSSWGVSYDSMTFKQYTAVITFINNGKSKKKAGK
jgi:hypothetical protein